MASESKKNINGELEIPGRQKVVRGLNVSALTSRVGLNLCSCTTLSHTPSLPSLAEADKRSRKAELSKIFQKNVTFKKIKHIIYVSVKDERTAKSIYGENGDCSSLTQASKRRF